MSRHKITLSHKILPNVMNAIKNVHVCTYEKENDVLYNSLNVH